MNIEIARDNYDKAQILLSFFNVFVLAFIAYKAQKYAADRISSDEEQSRRMRYYDSIKDTVIELNIHVKSKDANQIEATRQKLLLLIDAQDQASSAMRHIVENLKTEQHTHDFSSRLSSALDALRGRL